MIKIARTIASLVAFAGLWLITLGLLGSVIAFSQDMGKLIRSASSSVGIEGAVIRTPADRTPADRSHAQSDVTLTSATPSPLAEELVENYSVYFPQVHRKEPTKAASASKQSMQVTSPTSTVTLTPTPEPTFTPVPPTATASATPRPVGPPDRIVVPKINLDAPVVSIPQLELAVGDNVFAHWQAPNFYGVGWHDGSARLGEPGNTVMSGHNTIYGGVFDYLDLLAQEDEIIVYSGDRPYRYLISQVMIFEEGDASLEQRLENGRWITPSEDERITLVSCWPPRRNSHRIIVVAVPVD